MSSSRREKDALRCQSWHLDDFPAFFSHYFGNRVMMRVRMGAVGKNMIKVRELFRDDWMNMVDK